MIHLAVSSRSCSEKLSFPSTITPPRGGGVTSSSTSWPAGMVTSSPVTGILPPGQVLGSDQLRPGERLQAAASRSMAATWIEGRMMQYHKQNLPPQLLSVSHVGSTGEDGRVNSD